MLMKQHKNYRKILFYTVIAVFIGIIVGALDAVFGIALLRITKFRESNFIKLIPFLPVAGVLIMLLYRRFSKDSIKGMSLVFDTGLGNSDRIPKLLIPLVMLSTWITHLFGGSAGREGVAVQIGAAVAHTFGRRMKLPDNARVLIVVGMAAGFAGLFQTPLAATFFAMEVLVAGTIMYEALLPALAAAFAASYTSHLLGLEKFTASIEGTVSPSTSLIWKLIVIGVAFGITGGVFAYVLSASKKYFAKLLGNPVKRILIMGCGLAVLLCVLHFGRYSGLGTNLIELGFSDGKIYTYDFVIKIILTILTLSAGFQGGEVTPLFSIGTCLGIILGSLLGLPPELTAALGFAAVFGGASNTLLAPILIGAEVFGTEYILYFVVVCAIAYVFNGNQSIYGSQKQFHFFANTQDKDYYK